MIKMTEIKTETNQFTLLQKTHADTKTHFSFNMAAVIMSNLDQYEFFVRLI